MTGIRRQTVVVGLDGSPESMVAARWAAVQAARRHLALHLIYAYTMPMADASGYATPPDFSESARAAGRHALDEAAAAIRSDLPALEVSTEVVDADPHRALVRASANARLTVVGNHGGRRLTEVLLGSVALHVASHGRSPVAVIPPQVAVESSGPVLLGVDATGNATAAIGYAFDEAAVRGARLDAVLVWDDLVVRGFARAGTHGHRYNGEQHAVLAEQLAGWSEKYPDVTVHQVVVNGQPADGLFRYAESLPEGPQLVVLGSHGRGGLAGLLMGSTGQSLITRAAWPVLIVRDAGPS